MSVTYGFYNSLNGDRKYNALQMSSLFDGLINDGIYMDIGDQLMIKANEGLTLAIGEGRAWFNHTWTLNDSQELIDIETPDLLLDRIDAVVLEVDSTDAVRANAIKIIKGTPATEPVNPTLTNTRDVHQYPLAYVYVAKNATEITQANITNMVGTSETPYVTGILQKMNIDDLIAQWKQQWIEWMAEKEQESTDWTTEQRALWEQWVATQESDFDAWLVEYKAELTAIKADTDAYNTAYQEEMNTYKEAAKADFNTWFESVKAILDENAVSNLQNQIDTNAELEFNRYYGLIAKETVVSKDITDVIINIVETSDAAVSTTTFEETDTGKTITTEVIPTDDVWKYIKTTVIANTETGKTITESFEKIAK